MTGLIDVAINRTRTTLVILAMVVMAGIVSRCAIPVEADPNIEVPFIVITIIHPGISPEDAERLLVMPMEVELRSVEGVEELTAYAAQGSATLTVEFDASYDLDQALLDTREAVDRAKAKLPSEAEEPIVSEQSTSDWPILQINLVGESVPHRMLYNLAIDLKDQIEAVPDVLEADLSGNREQVLEAVIDPTLLQSYGISSEDVINTVRRNNRLVAAGSLDTGEGRFAVKVPSVIEEAQDLYDLPVKTDGDTVVTLSDVAEIRRTFKDRVSYARVNGRPAISVHVKKRADANVIDTIAQVKAVVERFRPDLPREVDLFYTQDQAPVAKSQVTELEGNILTALALVMVIVVGALGFRSGILVGLAIPVSFLISLAILYVIGYSFNFMVMFGMLLGLGMLVDGGIVVTEYADRKMVEGFDRRAAYSIAAKRMFWPVVASTATTLAAFLPLMFWPGVSGKFMRYLPVTVFAVLIGSLFYALVFGPTLGALFGKPGSRDEATEATLRELESGDPTRMRNLTGWYARLIAAATRRAPLTFGLTVAVLLASFALYGVFGRGMVFFNDAEPMFLRVAVKARGNYAAEQINALVREVEDEILEIPGIEDLNTRTTVGGNVGRGSMDRIGQMFIELHDESERQLSGTEIVQRIRARTEHLAGITVEVQEQEQGPPVGKPVQIELSSRDQSLLEPATARLRRFVDTVPGLRDIEDTRSLPGVEWKLSVNRARAALFGADVTEVGMAVQLVTNGVLVGKYRPDNAEDEVDIRIRYPDSERGIRMLDDLHVNTARGSVPISSFVTMEPVPRVDTIQRVDGIAVEYIRAEVAPGVLAANKVQEIQAWIDGQAWDPNLDIVFRGANEEQRESMEFVMLAFAMALVLMFLLLVTQFNSLYQSFLILFAVVMSTAGVLIGLVVTGSAFSAILTGIGVVALAGIVVNNNIILIDTYNHLRREHPELDHVSLIVRTGAQRLRPVMLTSVTTVFGVLPMALHYSIDFIHRDIVRGGQVSSFWEPLAQAIVWGLTFATLLTLVATPAMLALPHHFRPLFRRSPPSAADRETGPEPQTSSAG